jgi:cytochrome b6-f complex iron-sulfur subunit
MAKRTSEEILAQRDAWLARKTARESGVDIPMVPPTHPEEDPPVFPTPDTLQAAAEAETTEAAPEPVAASDPEPQVETAPPAPRAEAASPAPQAEAAQPADGAASEAPKPQAPERKRSKEEIAAQREAFLAARAAKAASKSAPAAAPAPAPTPAPAAVAEKPAPAPAKPAAAPRPKPAAPPRRKPAKAPKAEPEPAGMITRREFLNYAWLASIALFSLETVGISLWFAFPNFKEGEFGGLFPIGPAADVLPEVNAPPVPYTDGKFWLVNVDREVDGEPRKGVLALYKVCTHLGCLYQWAEVTSRFECPCHGSKFQLTGDYISGPARRSLDRFVIQAVGPDGQIRAQSTNGGPLQVNNDDTLVIDTGSRILGDPVA